MTNGVIAGTGNSRFLKSVANFLTLYPNYEAFVSELVSGTLPIDLNGVYEDGWTELGTPLNKANLLPDATATLLGLNPGSDPKIKDAFNNLAVLDGASAPTTSTVGIVKQFYLETSTPQLYQCTAASGGVYTWNEVGAAGLYEKIRDVADTSGTNVSIDVSGLPLATWQTIKIFGYVHYEAAATNTYFRINNLNGASSYQYRDTLGGSFSTASYFAPVITGVFAPNKIRLEFTINIDPYSSDYYVYSNGFNTARTSSAFATVSSSVSSLSTFNFVASNGTSTLHLTKCQLWGMRR